MNLPDFLEKNKKGLVKILNILAILTGSFLLFYANMTIAGTLFIVVGYFSVMQKDD